MQKQLPASNRNLLLLVKNCIFYTLPLKYPHVFTKIDLFIKIQLGNLMPESEDLFKDTFCSLRKKQILRTSKLKQNDYLFWRKSLRTSSTMKNPILSILLTKA